MYLVDDLYRKYETFLGLTLVNGKKGLNKTIKVPEAHRPGLSLSGYTKGYPVRRIAVLGRVEIKYLRDLSAEECKMRLSAILTVHTPLIIIARRCKPPKELVQICENLNIALFRSALPAMDVLSKLNLILADEFAPYSTCHGTLVEVFGLGVLIQGHSSVGKSETALGLIERGHRLVADDVVRVSKKKGGYLEGTGVALTKHIMEIRGIGIINVAHLYGAVCVRENKTINIADYVEIWDDQNSYERVGLEEKSSEILGCAVPFYVLPVKPGRDVVLLLETIALNHRLKRMGLNSAEEMRDRLHETIRSRRKRL